MPSQVTSKTFAQASTPSNRIVFTINSVTADSGFFTDSDLQFTFSPNNASPNPTPTRVQISPTLIEKVIVTSGNLIINTNMTASLGQFYSFAAAAGPYDFSESGGLPITIQGATVGNAIGWGTEANTTAQVVLRGYQIAPRN